MTDSSEHYLKRELDVLLREDDAAFAFIERAALNGMWYWDLESPHKEWMSTGFWQSLGYDAAEKADSPEAWRSLMHPEDVTATAHLLERHLADPTVPYDIQVRYNHANGQLVTMRCQAMAIRNDAGKATRMLGIHTNLTSERKVARLLTETNRAARVGAWEYDLLSGDLYWSDVTRDIHEVGSDFIPDVSQGVSFYREGYSRDKIQVLLKDAVDNGAPWDAELELKTAKGNIRWVKAVGRVERQGGRSVRIFGSFQDIHEQKLRDIELASRERMLRVTGEAARVGGWEFDLATGSVTYTDVTNQIHGLSGPQTWTSERATAYYQDGPEKDELMFKFNQCVKYGKPYQTDFKLRREDGAERWIRAFGRPRRDNNGIVTQVYGSLQDIHDQKIRDIQLAKGEELLRHNFEHAPNGMVIANANGYFNRISNSFIAMLGYSRDELMAKHFTEITHPADQAADKVMMKTLATGERDTWRTEKRYITAAGGILWADVSVSVLRDQLGAAQTYHVQLVDITAQRLAEQRRLRLGILEEKAREMERFAYVASHDLRQPVLTIKGYLEALEEDYGDKLDADAKSYVSIMNNALDRMDGMIKGLLDYSRISKAKQLQHVDLGNLVAEVVSDLHGLFDKEGAKVEVDALPPVMGYPLELRQLFQNLIANAVQYRTEAVTPIVKINCLPVEGGIQISVSDNGRGIPPGDQERIFELFQRGAGGDNKDNSGIGLSTCRSIVERHGGKLSVSSELGEGSIFRFTILSDQVPEESN